MNRYFLYTTVFVTGMAVMAVELTASRLLAPYFGASLFVWTNIIGVVLIALSFGYYIGGKLADRNEGKLASKILYPIIFITGILITLIPFIGKPIFLFAYSAIPQKNVSIFLSSLIATLILFLIPLLLIAMVTPLAARLGMKKLDTAGSVVGSLYAFSTLGSIIGTFLPVLVTIPFLGSRETFYLFGGILIFLGVLGMRRFILLGSLILPLILLLMPNAIHANPSLAFEGESIYNYIRVHRNRDGAKSLLTNEGLGIQSYYHPFRILTGYYWDAAAFLPLVNPDGKKYLIIGTAGASSARIIHHFFPNLELEGVEIDPMMISVGKKFFASDDIPMKIFENDGRVFLDQTKKKYDFIMVDVYRDELYIPFHLATKEFFDLVKARLTERGSMIMNIAAIEDSEMLRLLKNTVTASFPIAYEYRAPGSANSLIIAFREKPDFSKIIPANLPLDLRTLIQQILREIQIISHDPSQDFAIDNLSAIEFLTEKMIFSEIP